MTHQSVRARGRVFVLVLAVNALLMTGGLLTFVEVARADPLPTTVEARLYVRPDCLPDGDTAVLVQGRGFVPNERVRVKEYYSSGADTIITTDAYGSFNINWTLTHHGYNYIDTTYQDISANEPYLYIADCEPSIAVTPQCAAASTVSSIGIQGFHWDWTSGDSFQIDVYDRNGYSMGSNLFKSESESWTNGISFDGTLPASQYKVVVTLLYGSYEVQSAYNYFLVPCPELSVTPTCGPAGSPPGTFSLTITAGSPEVPLVLSEPFVEFVFYSGTGSPFNAGAHPQEFVADEPDAGQYLIQPYLRPAGTYTLLVKQGYSNGDDGFGSNRTWYSAKTTFTVPCFVATPTPSPTLIPPITAPPTQTSIIVDPTCGPPQLLGDFPLTQLLTVSGSGFLPGTLALTFDPDLLPETTPATAAADGTFSQLMTVHARAEGTYRIVAHQPVIGSFVPDAETSFTVPCLPPLPTLIADIPCGPPAAGLPFAYAINLAGSGFYPGRVDLSFDATRLLPELQPPATADIGGAFVATITPTGRGPGKFLIRAYQQVAGSGTTVEATADFVVACEPPTFALLHDHGGRGYVVIVEGHNFPPDADILLRWNRGLSAASPTVARTDANGSFVRQLLIFNSDFVGRRELSVELATDPLALASVVPAAYQVTMGTISPPFSLVDNPFAAPGATIVLRR